MVRRATTDNSVSYHLQPCKRKNRELTTLRLMGGILLYKIAILSQSKQLKDRCHDNLGYLPGVLFCPTPPRRWTILEDIQEQWLLCQIFLLFAAYQNLIFEIPHGRPFWAKNLSIPSFLLGSCLEHISLPQIIWEREVVSLLTAVLYALTTMNPATTFLVARRGKVKGLSNQFIGYSVWLVVPPLLN